MLWVLWSALRMPSRPKTDIFIWKSFARSGSKVTKTNLHLLYLPRKRSHRYFTYFFEYFTQIPISSILAMKVPCSVRREQIICNLQITLFKSKINNLFIWKAFAIGGSKTTNTKEHALYIPRKRSRSYFTYFFEYFTTDTGIQYARVKKLRSLLILSVLFKSAKQIHIVIRSVLCLSNVQYLWRQTVSMST
jgi:hypothetical protein